MSQPTTEELELAGFLAKYTPEMLANPGVVELMEKAVGAAKVPFAEGGKHRLIIKSVSAKQRPRRPAAVAE